MCQLCDRVLCSENAGYTGEPGNGTVAGNGTVSGSTPVEFSLKLSSVPAGDMLPGVSPSVRLEGFFARNGFERLGPSAFAQMPVFELLDLSNNAITSLDAMSFLGLGSTLVELNLSGNNLSAVAEGTYSELSQLVTLHLSNNEIRSLSRPASTTGLAALWPRSGNLHYLYLDGNGLESINRGALNGLRNLKWLRLSRNRLVNVAALCTASPPLMRLEKLFLSANDLGSGTFADGGSGAGCLGSKLSSLKTLDVSRNSLRSDSFTLWLGSLVLLDARDNDVRHTDACTLPPTKYGGNPLLCSCDLALLPAAASLSCFAPLTGDQSTIREYVGRACPSIADDEEGSTQVLRGACGRLSVSVTPSYETGTFVARWNTSRTGGWFYVDTIVSTGTITRVTVPSGQPHVYTGRLPDVVGDNMDGNVTMVLVCVVAVRNRIPAAYGQRRCVPLRAIRRGLDESRSEPVTPGSTSNRTEALEAGAASAAGEIPFLTVIFIGLFAGLLAVFILTVLCLTKTKGKPFSIFSNSTYGNPVEDGLNIYSRKPLAPRVSNSTCTGQDADSFATSSGKREVEGSEDALYEEMAECLAGAIVDNKYQDADLVTMCPEPALYCNTAISVRDSYESDGGVSLCGAAAAMSDFDVPPPPSELLPSISYVVASALEVPPEGHQRRSTRPKSSQSSDGKLPGRQASVTSSRRNSKAREDSVHYLYTYIHDVGETDDSDPRLSDPTYDPVASEETCGPKTGDNVNFDLRAGSVGSINPQTGDDGTLGPGTSGEPEEGLNVACLRQVFAQTGLAARTACSDINGNLGEPCSRQSRPRRHQSAVVTGGSHRVRGRVRLLEQDMDQLDVIARGQPGGTGPTSRRAVSVREKPVRRHSAHRSTLERGQEGARKSYHNVAFERKHAETGKMFF